MTVTDRSIQGGVHQVTTLRSVWRPLRNTNYMSESVAVICRSRPVWRA
jgi:hypothetical protein